MHLNQLRNHHTLLIGQPWEIVVYRNTMPNLNRNDAVASLNGKVKSHDDVVPYERAFWYWLRVRLQTGKTMLIGPLQVEADEKKAGKYVKAEDIYMFHVQRNANSARITWDVPGMDMAQLKIRRSTNMRSPGRPEIIVTREAKGHVDDMLPDPHADYWYWMEVQLQNGAIIKQSPKKAEAKDN